MDKRYFNKRFFEQSLFAIADEYCRVNLTQDLVPGHVCRVENECICNMNEQRGLPENTSLTDIIKVWSQNVSEEDRQTFRSFWDRENLLRRFEQGETHMHITYWCVTNGKQPKLVADYIAMFRDSESGDVMATNYVLDHTEEYHLEQYKNELEEKNRQLDALIQREREYQKKLSEAYESTSRQLDFFSESIAGGMKISRDDPEFSLKYVSWQFASMLGYESPEELKTACGGSFVLLVHPDEREQAKIDAAQYYAESGSYSVSNRLLCKDGSWKYVENHGRKVINSDGEVEYWNLMLDRNELVTKSIALETERQSNAAKNEFLARMSHDIRTPINGIIGLLDQDDRHPEDVAQLAKNREKIRKAADQLMALMNDMLELNRFNFNDVEMPIEEIDLEQILSQIKEIFETHAEEQNIELRMANRFSFPCPRVLGSGTYIRQILFNVINNAIKYSEPFNSVMVTAVQERRDQDTVELIVRVRDNGIGMSEEFLPRIFDPFSQERKDARGVYRGNGLGMSIVKTLVDRMNGKISVVSKASEGTTVDMTLPFRTAPSFAEASPADHESEYDLTGLRALLVEDNELNMEIANFILEDARIIVTQAHDGAEALERFRSAPVGSFDVILMDIMMPVMDGLEATAAIRALDRPDAKQIPIIAVTANAFQEDTQRCLEAGMDFHLPKPLSAEKVHYAIRKLCGSSRK